MGDSIIRPKLVLLGESAVGKSSIVMRFVKSSFREHQEATIGAAFTTQTIWVGEPKRAVKFEIWDTAGQERYHSLTPMYYRGAAAAVVVYDITNTQSFSKAQTWVKELHEKADKMRVIALVGNKTDLESRRTVVTESSEAYAAQEGLLFYETSAKVGTNIGEVFEDIALHLPLDAASTTSSGQNLDGDAANAGSRSCCR